MTEPSPASHPPDPAISEPFEIRRRSWLIVLLVIVPWGLAAGYGWLARDREEPLLWIPAAALVLLGLVFAAMLRHVATPLLVADLHGVRLLTRRGWVGFLWREMGEIQVDRRRGPRRPARVRVRGLEDERDHVVPLGLGTNVSAPRAEIELARRREAASY